MKRLRSAPRSGGSCDILDCLARPEVGEGGAHVRGGGSIGWRHLREVSGETPASGIVDGLVDQAIHRSFAGLPLCGLSPFDANIGQRSPTRLWQSDIGWGGVASRDLRDRDDRRRTRGGLRSRPDDDRSSSGDVVVDVLPPVPLEDQSTEIGIDGDGEAGSAHAGT